MDDIHSCSYFCDRPACVKAQRDKLREILYEREWVGLTNREIQEIADRIEVDEVLLKTPTWHIRFARAVQRKLKGKNT